MQFRNRKRLLVVDDEQQAKKVARAIAAAESSSEQVLVLPEVLIENAWVLESIYRCERKELVAFMETLLSSVTFTFPDPAVIKNAVGRFKKVVILPIT